MNSTLIIGGLLGVGLLALVALIFVARGEGRSQEPAEKAASPPAPVDGGVPPTYSDAPTRKLPLEQDQQWWTGSDGQIQDLATEIQSAHRQAQEIEQRLGLLSEIVGRIERTHNINRSIHIEEELPHTPGMA